MHVVFLLAACTSILAVVLICIFLFANGIPAIGKIGVFDFLLGTKWKPLNDLYGIFPMILGSIYVTAGALVIGVPIGLGCAVLWLGFAQRDFINCSSLPLTYWRAFPLLSTAFLALWSWSPSAKPFLEAAAKVCSPPRFFWAL